MGDGAWPLGGEPRCYQSSGLVPWYTRTGILSIHPLWLTMTITGGGYYAPASSAHFKFLEDVVNAVVQSGEGKSFAAFVPSYTLAPHARYPTQLREGLEVLQYLVEGEGKLLENIVIGGDSAGGNLVLGILSHMSHPHPHPDFSAGLGSCFMGDGSLCGALMLSPWVSNDRTWPSVRRNKLKDCVTTVPTDISTEHFLGVNDDWDNYNEPLRAPEWWAGVKSRNLLIVSGEDEIMTDAHRAFGRILQVRRRSTYAQRLEI